MRKVLIAALVLLQFLILGKMVLDRETLLKHGRKLVLATEPVDPRDMFRGDYVRLSYAMNSVAEEDYHGPLPFAELQAGQRIYALLQISPDGVARLQYLQSERPESGVFIRGRVLRIADQSLQLRYGIEQYFVEQGQGLELERRVGSSTNPLRMEVTVGADGSAVISGYR